LQTANGYLRARSDYGLYLIQITEFYGWTIEENVIPGKGAQFTIIISKVNEKGKINYQLH
jgi:hypothetical protein